MMFCHTEDFDTITTLEFSHIATPEEAALNLTRFLPLLALDPDGDTRHIASVVQYSM
jgi:hypothetical protein